MPLSGTTIYQIDFSLSYSAFHPISTERAQHERLNKKTALAVFSPDALSSVAHSREAILTAITFAVLIVITPTEFTHGAWAVVRLIPLIVLMFRSIHGHYRLVAAQLSLDHAKPLPSVQNRLIIPLSGVHRGVLPALQYARSLVGNGIGHATAVYVEINPQHTSEMLKEWEI